MTKRAPISSDHLLTLHDAAAYLRIHPRTVRAYVHRGLLPGRLIGRRWKFRREDLATLFENAPSSWDSLGSDGDEK
jgi:excisionase family DNA binding protein